MRIGGGTIGAGILAVGVGIGALGENMRHNNIRSDFDTPIANVLDETKTNVDSSCSEEVTIASTTEISHMINSYETLNNLILNYNGNNPKVEIITTPVNDSEANEFVEAGNYYDVYINLETPVTVNGMTFSQAYINLGPDSDFILGKFSNQPTGNQFPMIRFIQSKSYNEKETCQEARYYSDTEGVNEEGVSLGINIEFNHSDYSALLSILIKELSNQ